MKFESDGESRQIDLSQHLDALYSYAMVLSRNRAEAEDLVQETCLRALRNLSTLRSGGHVKSWLYTILRNVWLNQLRQRRSAPEMVEIDSDQGADSDPPDKTADPHTVYASKVEQEQVRAAIQQLPVEYREMIILREYEELSYQEIASVLSCPLGTVMSRLARARSRLGDLLPLSMVAPRLEEKELKTGNGTAA